jgi:hypothetical protein
MTAEPSIEVRRARAELASALTAIEDKLNVPKRTKRAVRSFRDEHPAGFVAATATVVVAIGGAVFLGIRAFRNR